MITVLNTMVINSTVYRSDKGERDRSISDNDYKRQNVHATQHTLQSLLCRVIRDIGGNTNESESCCHLSQIGYCTATGGYFCIMLVVHFVRKD